MKKNIIFIIFMMFLVSGCTANYTIEVKDGMIKESLYVSEFNMTKALELDDMEMSFRDYALEYGKINDYYTSYYKMYSDDTKSCAEINSGDCKTYNKEFIDKEDEVGFILSSDFTYDEYSDATIPNDMIPGFSSSFDGKYLTLSGGTNWNFLKGYKNLDGLKITIKTDYYVESTNAKYKGNGVYEFDVSKVNNKDLDPLYIIFDTTSTKRYGKEVSPIINYILLGVLSGIIIIVGTRLYNKYKSNNRL